MPTYSSISVKEMKKRKYEMKICRSLRAIMAKRTTFSSFSSKKWRQLLSWEMLLLNTMCKKIMCQKSCLLCSDNYKQWSSYRSWQKKKLRTEIRKKTYHDSCLSDQDLRKNTYSDNDIIISSLYSGRVLYTKNCILIILKN